ncbi:hypothetical protein ACTWQL_06550 [Pseudalkalibacillus sp. R45]|uniref:hypothetical protein n=1 Tax=Pseudalkalibacillus sp. R45 TaxID=3457433 RepID=UPI003FCD1916
MESLIIRSFHKDEVRFAFVYEGRLFTMIMKWSVDNNHWNLHTYDQELRKNPEQYRFIVERLLSTDRVKEFFKDRNIKMDSVYCKGCNNVSVE